MTNNSQDISDSEIYVQQITLNEFPDIYDSSNTDQLFGITIDGEILKTPNENPLVHKNERFLRGIVTELDFTDELDVSKISLYNLACTQIDFMSDGMPKPLQCEKEKFDIWFLNDVVLRSCAGPEVDEQMKYLDILVKYLNRHNIEYPHLPQTVLIEECSKEYFEEHKQEAENFEKLVDHFFDLYRKLNPYQITVFRTVVTIFESPILALLLANQKITANEFAITYLTAHCINSKVFSGVNRKEEKEALQEITKDAECMLHFLDLTSTKKDEIELLIEKGESCKLEFKSTLRRNLKTNQSDSEIENSVLKTIVAFLNSQGGTLFIGVNDDGEAIGIEADNFSNEDKYLLHFANLVNSRIGKEFSSFIKWDTVTYKNKKIMEVECQPSDNPVFLKSKQEELFFVRTGPSSVKLSMSEFANYSKNRFA